MYQLKASTALMKSHKAAEVLSDQSSFEVLQSANGLSLFFGIGNTNKLYLSAEQTNVATGWTPIELTEELAANYPQKTVTAKAFAVGQDPDTGHISIAQIVHIAEANTDALYMLTGLSHQPGADWMQSPQNRAWVACPYDGEVSGSMVDLQYAKVPVGSSQDQASPYVVAGVKDATTGYVRNFVVSPSASSGVWTLFPNAKNFDTLGSMATGRPATSRYGGLYQIFSLDGAASLSFSPWRAPIPHTTPNVTPLTIPAGATALSTVPSSSAGSDLYVAGSGAIYLFPANAQQAYAQGIAIISDPMIAGVQSLRVHVANPTGSNTAGHITVWGHTSAGVVFYSRCALGSQADPAAWSAPIPLLTGIDQLATMLDLTTGASVLYGHTSAQGLIKLAQDPVTTQWRRQSILLPTLALHPIAFHTYSTRIEAVDENDIPLQTAVISLTSSSPCSVYIEDLFLSLSSVPVNVTTDSSGSVTIVQETQTLGAVCYNLVQGDGTILNVNPMLTSIDQLNTNMAKVSSGADLNNVQVTDESGQSSTLVPANTPVASSDAVVKGIGQFLKTSKTLPQNGDLQTSNPALGLTRAFDTTQGDIWGVAFSAGGLQYFEGAPSGGIVHGIESLAGDIFKWLEHAIDDVAQFFVQVIGDVTHFFIEIGKKIYHFVMQCVNDVVHGIQFILNAIKVAWDKIVQWVGFIFSWGDIVCTHKVIKNIILQYSTYAVAGLGDTKAEIAKTVAWIEAKLKAWDSIPSSTDSFGTTYKNGTRPKGSSSPQAHYGSNHLKHNLQSSKSNCATPSTGGADAAAAAFEAKLNGTMDSVNPALGDTQTQVSAKIKQVTPLEAVENVVKDLLEAIVQLIGDALEEMVDLIGAMVGDAFTILTTPIDIPVLSWLYSEISGHEQLTILDLACLVIAIPVTIVMKVVTEETPFPQKDALTLTLQTADFAGIQAAYANPPALTRLIDEHGQPMMLSSSNHDPADKLNLAASICAASGALGITIVALPKFLTNPKWSLGFNRFLSVLYFVFYVPYVLPNIASQIVGGTDPDAETDVNTAITSLAILKTAADIGVVGNGDTWSKRSAFLESIINLLWLGPAIASIIRQHSETSEALGFAGNVAFDIGGIVTPLTLAGPKSDAATAVFIGQEVANVVYGGLMLSQGFAAWEESSHPG